MKNKIGQSIFEYVLLFVVVAALLLVFLNPEGRFIKSINGTLDQSINYIGEGLKKK